MGASNHLCKIEFSDVTFSFEDRPILDGVSFCVQPGELKVILGGSGTGKSTLLKLAVGLYKPDRGRILIDGEDITQMDEARLNKVRQRIGMIFQSGALFSSLSVFENVAFRPYEVGWDERKIEREVRRVLQFVGLLEQADQLPDELSGGMKQRVAIARAVIDKPDILLFDEPTSGLDPPTARSICELVIRLRDLEGVTSLFVTHELTDVRFLSSNYVEPLRNGKAEMRREDHRLCLINTRFVMLHDGRATFDGTDEQLWASEDEYIRAFVGRG
jgi:phospholipid/cholesterol/gamma-HCH transport system ATP-binding protein